jgi:uncharacterized protein with ParB-like and HNH nuclease domain
MNEANDSWYDSEDEVDQSIIKEYDISASPNDFNVLTLFSFIESGAVSIPGFQRNYVWDIGRASRLIESLIIGLPIPQLFLYEQSRNKYLVIDGQQRLMSIYYFIKKRFPLESKRAELRQIFDRHGRIPTEIIESDEYFSRFALKLARDASGKPHYLAKLNYDTLGDFKLSFDLRAIRNIVIKQNIPDEDDSSVYEIFNRLNSGGVNLTPQEIRTSLYHSEFYDLLYRLNLDADWRKLLDLEDPDLNMKDIEILLRGFGLLMEGENYNPSMKKFLNSFSKKSRLLKKESLELLENVFRSFLKAVSLLPTRSFHGKATKKFNISMFDAVFSAVCRPMLDGKQTAITQVDILLLNQLKEDSQFIEATQHATASKSNFEIRLNRAREILGS